MFSYNWNIHKVRQLVSEYPINEPLSSPVFNFNESRWQLVVYPRSTKRYINAHVRAEVKSQEIVDYVLSAKDTDDKILTEFNECAVFTVGRNCSSISKFLKRSDPLKVLKEDVLKINITIYMGKYSSECVLYSSSERAAFGNLNVLLQNKVLTDFIIKRGKFELPVHKAVLAANSSVFSKMFQSDSLENKEGYMMITDISKETLILLADFLYNGQIEKLPYDEAKELLYVADKYNMVDLMQICEIVLTSELKTSNAFDALLFADIHQRRMLKNAALDYMVENHWEFSNELKLQEILEKSPQSLLKEILSKLLSMLPRETKVEQFPF